jgi:hypothetical protein
MVVFPFSCVSLVALVAPLLFFLPNLYPRQLNLGCKLTIRCGLLDVGEGVSCVVGRPRLHELD